MRPIAARVPQSCEPYACYPDCWHGRRHWHDGQLGYSGYGGYLRVGMPRVRVSVGWYLRCNECMGISTTLFGNGMYATLAHWHAVAQVWGYEVVCVHDVGGVQHGIQIWKVYAKMGRTVAWQGE